MLILIRNASPDFRNTKLLLSLSCEQISISATARPTEPREASRLEKRAKPKSGGRGGWEDWGLEGRRKGSHFVPTCFARQFIYNGFAAGVEAFLREPGHCVSKV